MTTGGSLIIFAKNKDMNILGEKILIKKGVKNQCVKK